MKSNIYDNVHCGSPRRECSMQHLPNFLKYGTQFCWGTSINFFLKQNLGTALLRKEIRTEWNPHLESILIIIRSTIPTNKALNWRELSSEMTQGSVLNAALKITIINLLKILGGTIPNYGCYWIGKDSQYVTLQNQNPNNFNWMQAWVDSNKMKLTNKYEVLTNITGKRNKWKMEVDWGRRKLIAVYMGGRNTTTSDCRKKLILNQQCNVAEKKILIYS